MASRAPARRSTGELACEGLRLEWFDPRAAPRRLPRRRLAEGPCFVQTRGDRTAQQV